MSDNLNGRVQSVDRALALLEVLASGQSGFRLTELSRTTGLSLTTVHRLLTTLEMRKFVHFSADDSHWHIGFGAFAVGTAFEEGRNFAASAIPYLSRLRDRTKETANLGVAEANEIILLSQVPSREIDRSVACVGGRTPMTASGMGKAVLSSYSTDELQQALRQQGVRRLTPKTIADPNELTENIRQARDSGFAIDDEENRQGVRCIAAPVFNRHRHVVCAISISGMPHRITDDRVSALGRIVSGVAAELSELAQRPSLPYSA